MKLFCVLVLVAVLLKPSSCGRGKKKKKFDDVKPRDDVKPVGETPKADPYRNSKLKSQNMDRVNITDEFGLIGEVSYPDVVDVTWVNFKRLVMSSQAAWIVVVYKNELQTKWVEHAKHVKGSLFYGKIDIEQEPELVKQLDEELSSDVIKSGVAFVFPNGGKTSSSSSWPKKTRKVSEAERFASTSFKDLFEKLNFNPDKMDDFNNWMIRSFYKSNPPKFPVICLTDLPDSRIPLPYLAISYLLDSHFSFGLVHRDDFDLLKMQIKQIPEPKTYPSMLIMLGKEPSQDEMRKGEFGMSFNILPFIHAKYGNGHNFHSILAYLYLTNNDYRQFLPGRHADESDVIKRMTSVTNVINKRVTKVIRAAKKSSKLKDEL